MASKADKRTVATDALETLGTLIGPNEKRDAIHLGVDPAIAGCYLEPGDHVTLRDGQAIKTKPGKGIGIVDPFLLTPVDIGQLFWLVVYPRKITSLRHVWEHPDFPTTSTTTTASTPHGISPSQESTAFIETVAEDAGISCQELLEAAAAYLESGEYLCDGGRWEGFGVPADFWNHYQRVTGTVVTESQRGNFFTCSC